MEPEIIFDSPACLVVNKPGGVLTQAPPGIDSMEVRMKRFLKTRLKPGALLYCGLPHRLDRPVSGAMLFATSKKSTKKLCRQFEHRSVSKKYWAIVEGQLTDKFDGPSGSLSDYMRKVPDQARSEIVEQDSEKAQYARLNYRILQEGGDFTWLEIELETGRTHQIRLQLGSRGNPIIGDSMYGATSTFGPEETDERKRWIGLHARHLRFEHPETGEVIRIEAPLPSIWTDFVTAR